MSTSEFEAVLGQAIIKLEKVLYERGEVPSLKDAHRELQAVVGAARDAAKLKGLRDKLDRVSEVLRVEIPHDDDLRNDLWDCLDFIDYRV